MATWDIAREPFDCGRCQTLIGQGEAFRVARVARKIGYCEDCSVAIDGQTVPDHIDTRDFLTRLRDDIAQHAPKDHHPEFSTFDRTSLSRTLKSNILSHRAKPTAASVQRGSQPAFDPRGQQTRQRHGVAEAIRNTTDTDWHAVRAKLAGGRS